MPTAGEGIVLLLGKDSNESHLQQEELETVSLRNDYILSSISDIFRLMLHIDLTNGETVVCSVHPDHPELFSTDAVYSFSDVSERLIQMVHPADREALRDYLSLETLRETLPDGSDNKIATEYRRIDPDADPDKTAKWTRSVLTFTAFDESRRPTEAVPETAGDGIKTPSGVSDLTVLYCDPEQIPLVCGLRFQFADCTCIPDQGSYRAAAD